MRYFKHTETQEVFGYDETYENDLPLIEQAIADGLEDISDVWPPAPAFIPEPSPLTPKQKLENAGLTVDELKQLLGIR